jgi:hypothetical protein
MCKRCDPRPYCYWCGEGTARVLPCQDSDTLQGPVFCSLFCAARCAFHSERHFGLHWCVQCQQWHDSQNGCDQLEPATFVPVEDFE